MNNQQKVLKALGLIDQVGSTLEDLHSTINADAPEDMVGEPPPRDAAGEGAAPDDAPDASEDDKPTKVEGVNVYPAVRPKAAAAKPSARLGGPCKAGCGTRQVEGAKVCGRCGAPQ